MDKFERSLPESERFCRINGSGLAESAQPGVGAWMAEDSSVPLPTVIQTDFTCLRTE